MERSEIEKLIKEEVLYVVSQMKDTLLLQLIGFMEQEKYETDHGIPKTRPEKLENNRHLAIDLPEDLENEAGSPTPVLERVSSVNPDSSDE